MTEEDVIVEDMLNRTFFKAWKNAAWKTESKYELYKSLELMVSAHCNQQCKYCYYQRYGKDHIYPNAISKPDTIIKNCKMILDWLEKNQYYPEFNLFSGEIFIQRAGIEVIKMVSDFHKRNKLETNTTIPTNMSFLFDDKKTKMVEDIIKKGNDDGLHIHLSASVDGKFCDDNRPFKNPNMVKTDEWYDKFFNFVRKYNTGLHPMVYSNKIEKWKDNFNWFQDNLIKRGLSWKSIYLLEVRNEEWTKEQLNEYYKFMRYVANYGYQKAKESGVEDKNFATFCHDNKLFNVFTLFGTVGRGTSCSIQTTAQIRLGDMKHVLCHRAAYKPHELWEFAHDGEKITGINPLNVPGFISYMSADKRTFPVCESCMINDFCIGQCWGSMFESNKDHFVPIPSVCALEHIKVKAIFDEIYDLKLHTYFHEYTNNNMKKIMSLYFKRYKGVRL